MAPSPYKNVQDKWCAYVRDVQKIPVKTHVTCHMFNLTPDMTEYDMYKFLLECNRLNDYKSMVIAEGRYVMYKMDYSGVWREDEGCNDLIVMIRDLIDNVNSLRTWLVDFLDKNIKSFTQEEIDIVERKFKGKEKKAILVDSLKKKLGQSRYPNNVLKIIKEQLCDNAWYRTMDSDPMLLGFEDCVYHLGLGRKLKLHEISGYRLGGMEFDSTFDPINNKEYAPVTLSTKLGLRDVEEYVNNSANKKYKENYEDFVKKIHPDESLREYFLDTQAMSLDGTNKTQEFYFWTGSGANGKSVFFGIIEMAVGKYFETIDSKLLLDGDKSANGASPATAEMKGKRILRFDEPDKSGKMKAGLIKRLSSGTDYIKARELYGKIQTFINQGTCNVLCNHMPSFSDVVGDNGFARRTKVIPFTSRFIKNPTVGKKNEFLVDDTISLRSIEEKWHYFLIWDLLQRYKKGVPNAPEMVLERSNEYLSTQDHLKLFIEQTINSSNDKTDVITLADIKKKYKKWCKRADEDPLRPGEFATLLKLKLDGFTEKATRVKGKEIPYKNVFEGYLFDDDQDDQDDEVLDFNE